jgi:hypothetical protein
MTLNTVPSTRAGSRPSQEGVAAAVSELQRLKITVVAGAGANTNIAVAGIATTDTLLAVHRHIDPAATSTAAVVDHTAQASITSAGNVQVSVATNTNAGDRLVIYWYDKA